MTAPAPLLSTGIPGLDDVLGGGFRRTGSTWSRGTPAPGRRRSPCGGCWRGGRGEGDLRHPVRDQGRARRRRRSHGWSLAGINILELVAPESELEPDNQTPCSSRPRSNWASPPRPSSPRSSGPSPAGRHRLAVGDAPARPEPAALPPADPGPQAVLHRPGVHGVPARRPDVRGGRPAAPEHRPRGREPGAARRPSTAPSGGGCASRSSGGRSTAAATTTSSSQGRAGRLPAARRGGTRPRPRSAGCSRPATRSWTPSWAGGCEYGTSVVLLGPAGSGKSTLAIQYARAAAGAASGPPSSPSTSGVETMLRADGRARDGPPRHLDSGHIAIQPMDTAELSPGEFAHRVRRAAEGKAAGPGRRWSSSTA